MSVVTLTIALLVEIPTTVEAAVKQAPSFTIRNLRGESIRLSQYSDAVVVMAFWATWCKPCLAELKHLEKLYKKHKSRGLVVLGINMDGPETQGRVPSVVKRYRLSFPVVIDKDMRVSSLYNPRRSAPFSVLISEGHVVKSRDGFQKSDESAIEADILALLR